MYLISQTKLCPSPQRNGEVVEDVENTKNELKTLVDLTENFVETVREVDETIFDLGKPKEEVATKAQQEIDEAENKVKTILDSNENVIIEAERTLDTTVPSGQPAS